MTPEVKRIKDALEDIEFWRNARKTLSQTPSNNIMSDQETNNTLNAMLHREQEATLEFLHAMKVFKDEKPHEDDNNGSMGEDTGIHHQQEDSGEPTPTTD